MVRPTLGLVAVLLSISQAAAFASGSDEDRLHFSDRRAPEEAEYRRAHGRPQNNGGGSYIENVFKIPIAVIKGTSAAAQAFSPQNTETINKIFDIPVMTLDAVGNFIKETRPQRPEFDDFDAVETDADQQRPVRLGEANRDQRRERIMRIREEERQRRRQIEQDRLRRRLAEQERQRRRIQDQQKRFHHGNNHQSLDLFSDLVDLLGGGGHGHLGFFGSHGHGHGGHGSHGKPPHRPLKPTKPSASAISGGSQGNLEGDSDGYEVHEQLDEEPVRPSGIFSWLQPSSSQSGSNNNRDKIQNKIAPGAEWRSSRDRVEFRYA